MNNVIQECYNGYTTLRSEMGRWLKQSMMLDPPGPNNGGEDEANYALSWFPHYLITGNVTVLQHFDMLKAALLGWVKRDCLHGYEPKAEAHHGPEPFLLFLPRYIGLMPEDTEATALLTDAAEHIGNWVPEIPPWYDYDRDTFIGYNIGSRDVKNDEKDRYELAEHFRFIHIALAAYRVTGEEHYLTWALRYGRKRAERLIAAPDPMPLLWTLDGEGLDEAAVDAKNLHRLVASSHHIPNDPLAGIEVLLASGAIYALGDLYLLSGEEIFKTAAKRIVAPLVTSLSDPFNDPAAAALSYYRWTFEDTCFDEAIRLALADLPDAPPELLALVFPQENRRREPGVGKRADMAYWGEWSDDGSVKPIQEPSTATLTLAYQVTGEVVYAMRALRSAATRLGMARRVLRGGREHADMGGAVCSVAAGHGRNWGQGAVTACYGPLLLGTREVQSEVTQLLEVQQSKGRNHPPMLLSLVRPILGNREEKAEVVFYNGGNAPLTFSWRFRSTGEASGWYEEVLAAHATQKRVL
ncbi:MAG: hypothetical protein OXC79_11510 [Candidatus Poribacteria bacterium]|nr:hypothetical protein [Candidatus Poribacteria bacterium]